MTSIEMEALLCGRDVIFPASAPDFAHPDVEQLSPEKLRLNLKERPPMIKRKSTDHLQNTRSSELAVPEVSWEELERTSLWDSVDHLVDLSLKEEAARKATADEKRKRSEQLKLRKQLEEVRRDRARTRFLEDVNRQKALELAIARAQSEGRSLAQTVAEELAEPHLAQLELRRREHHLELVRAAGRIDAQKHRLRHFLIAAVTCLVIGGGAALGLVQKTTSTVTSDLAALRSQAEEEETQARQRVAALERELESRTFLAAAEEGQLLEALRIARIEMDAAHEQALEYDTRKQAPKKLAAVPRAVEKAALERKVETGEQGKAPATTMAYDFGMAKDECNAHDPLCGNL